MRDVGLGQGGRGRDRGRPTAIGRHAVAMDGNRAPPPSRGRNGSPMETMGDVDFDDPASDELLDRAIDGNRAPAPSRKQRNGGRKHGGGGKPGGGRPGGGNRSAGGKAGQSGQLGQRPGGGGGGGGGKRPGRRSVRASRGQSAAERFPRPACASEGGTIQVCLATDFSVIIHRFLPPVAGLGTVSAGPGPGERRMRQEVLMGIAPDICSA